MAEYADLEVGIHRWERSSYAIDLRFLGPKQDSEDRLLDKGPALVSIDTDALKALPDDPAEYGRALTRSLFATEALRSAFKVARDRAKDSILRLRIFVGPSAPELHSLKWETLLDPNDPWVKADPAVALANGGPLAGPPPFLATNERTPFSRYLTAVNFRAIPPRTEDVFRVLAVIANPAEIDRRKVDGIALQPVDVARERDIIESFSKPLEGRDVRITTLASNGQSSVKSLIDQLRRGDPDHHQPFDMLYIVAHGMFREHEPVIFLEDEHGGVDPIYGKMLVDRIKNLAQLPRVVVLASCQSGGDSDEIAGSDSRGVLAALGPSLADAGVPAVLAMLGSVTMKTMAAFLPVFLDTLLNDGQIDVAVAAARGHVRDRHDAWMPVLYSRLRSGRIWYKGGMEGKGTEFENWEGLLTYIESGDCTPVLGSGLVESVIGSTREIARRWADTYHFPMSPNDREDLPQVAQYLAANQGNAFPKLEMELYLKRELQRRFRKELADETRDDGTSLLSGDAELDDIIAALGAQRRHGPDGEFEPHRVLASLPCPVYITTNYDRLMFDALAETPSHFNLAQPKKPEIGVFGWDDGSEPDNSVFRDNPKFRPKKDTPLVYHLHGRLDRPKRIVLKVDEYFDYLIGVTGNRKDIPLVVRSKMTDCSLLLLGYRLDDWDFRVLFRSIRSQPGAELLKNYKHVAVQLDLETEKIVEPDLARRYFERYFQGAEVTIYWGKSEDFLRDLYIRWQARVNAHAGV